MTALIHKQPSTRIGFHYYPDSLHFRDSDLKMWLPELKALRVDWLVLSPPLQIVIPESFMVSLLEAGIQPILHFKTPINPLTHYNQLELLFSSYSKWGVRYVAFFDRPNSRYVWSSPNWVQSDLVERFLDIFIPVAEKVLSFGMTPIFPPLEPGGDYWDTAFLKEALNGLKRRGCQSLINTLVLGAYAYASDPNKPLDWGKGGPERWPQARPYMTPQGHEDHRGFHIYEWYTAISQAVTSQNLPIILFGVGEQSTANPSGSLTEEEYNQRMFSILQATWKSHKPDERPNTYSSFEIDTLPTQVLACNYWLLASSEESPQPSEAWYPVSGEPKSITKIIKKWVSEKSLEATAPDFEYKPQKSLHIISHYLLLPLYEWGVSEWHLDAIRPFILKYRPTIGFSPEEAFNAQLVTLVGGYHSFPEELERKLREAGCEVERISGDGTAIASQLASR